MKETSFFRKKKILVVEDDADQLELLRWEFKEHGFAIATAANGQEAVRKARSLQPDLVLLDVMLPDVNGFAVCELLRRDQCTAQVPVLMVSGLPGELPRCTGFDAGATDFVSKPISPSDLVARVKELLLRGVAAQP